MSVGQHVYRSSMAVVGLIVLGLLAACADSTGKAPPKPGAGPSQPPVSSGPPPTPIIDKTLFTLPKMKAEGREPVRVGLLLPLSGPQAALGKTLLDSAQLAVFESGRNELLLLPHDTRGTAAGAAEAASAAVSQGAEVILGPLTSEEVSAAAPIGQANRVSIIAFSSTLSVAAPGVYLLSFPPALDVERVVGHAITHGVTRIAALIPESSYGAAIETALRDSAQLHSLTLGPVIHYSKPGDMDVQVKALAKAGGFDAVLLPDGGSNIKILAPLLTYSGINMQTVRILGTGLWDDPTVLREPSLRGGWFAAPPPDARQSFAQRYRTAFGSAAPRIASLAYDGVALIAALADGSEGRRFTPAKIADPSGFVGVDGVFRFDADGRISRALAVNEVTSSGGVAVISPAPRSFQGASQ